jgi:predicted ribosomally synthesized peptide with SipW-like signal peptide
MNKRMILSGGMLVFMAAIVAGGTGAFFSDTETSTGNVFTAGSVSIGFGGIDHVYAYGDGSDPVEGYFSTTTANNIPRFALDDLKPRDAGRLTFDLDNGANEAYVCGLVTGTAPETDPDMALYDNLQFYNSDDDQVTFGSWFDLGTLDANQTDQYEIDYCFGEGQGTACAVESGVDYNAAQNGSFSADLQLFAIQTRNNENFSCDQLENVAGVPTYTPVTQPLVGADLDSYEAPAGAAITGSIQAAIDAASANDVIVVADGTYTENVLVNKSVTISAENQGAAILAGSFSISADDVTIEGFTITGGDTSSPSDNGINVAPSTDGLTISHNVIDGTGNTLGIGIEVSDTATNLTIEQNTITKWTASGTYLNLTTGPVTITYNDYHSNNVGIGTDGINNVSVTRNDFAGNSAEAMGVDGTGSTIAINQNNFTPAGVGNDVNAYDSVTGVNATGNYWAGEAVVGRTNLPGDIDTTGEAVTAFPN